MAVDPVPPVDRAADGRERVRYLLTHLWRGNQRAMARAIGVSQGLISKVVNGRQAPGRRLLAALAGHPGVNPDWVDGGTGRPVEHPESGSLPVAGGVLPGLPLASPHLLTGARHPVAAALDRTSRYWVVVAAGDDVARESALRLAPGDLLLLDADPAWTRRPDLTAGRVCGVRLTAPLEPEYRLGRVVGLPSGVVVRLFGDSFVPPRPAAPSSPRPSRPPRRRTIRPLEEQERRAREAERVRERARAEARDGLPIRQEDVVAVQVYMVRPGPLPA